MAPGRFLRGDGLVVLALMCWAPQRGRGGTGPPSHLGQCDRECVRLQADMNMGVTTLGSLLLSGWHVQARTEPHEIARVFPVGTHAHSHFAGSDSR